jgi:hypothetical protein
MMLSRKTWVAMVSIRFYSTAKGRGFLLPG